MRAVILDTNGFLRLILDDVKDQADRVEDIVKRAKKNQIRIFVPQIILFEMNFVLQKYYLFKKQ